MLQVKPIIDIEDYLVGVLNSRLESKQRVLWLIPGGSSISIAVAVSKRLDSRLTNNLYLTLTDERFGEMGHADENWLQLINAGFSFADSQVFRVLSGLSVEKTRENYENQLREWFENIDYRLGFFGIGADGHTAGIKPGSRAINSSRLVDYFVGEDFERITITPKAVAELDETVAFATGDEKYNALAMLVNDDLSIEAEPAQCLKLAEKFTLFTDQKLDVN